ncbi:HDOD domain-containing protein [Halomonas sp. NO4]|uniref:EAL and HDOD domain-containing protein n=1 Tax=Halomonas sp. NO4 TaxID=2484813 RepID=UPI0013D22137|nr:HDOD domain-containing protein [Halomonas sp. NO4]
MSESRDLDPCTLALQPIHDSEHRHVAERLLYRLPADEASDDVMAATARALTAAVYELGDTGLLAERLLFVSLPMAWLQRPELLPTPASRLVIGLDAAAEPSHSLARQLDEMRERGYRLILPASLVKRDPTLLLPRTDIVQLTSPDDLDDSLRKDLAEGDIALLAEHIDNAEQLARYQALGCHYYDGQYLAKPSFLASRPRGRHGNRAAQIRLIQALYDENTDLQRLQELVVQMPHLHVAILRRANSSYFNRGGKEVVDLRRGMQILGLIELRRLILTLTLASLQPSSHIVLRMALVRAFMCRNLAAPFPDLDPEDAFNTGLFSMMDALLEEDRESLLDKLPLNATIIRALKDRSGPLGAVLSLCEGHEHQVETMPDEPRPDQLHRCYMAALDSTRALMGNL